MIVAIRADASIDIGTGHVMRCLSLADELKARGHTCVFLSRPHPGELGEFVERRGHRQVWLPLVEDSAVAGASDPPHQAWLCGAWESDALHARSALKKLGAQLLIVDHYALDGRWESEVSFPELAIVAIDDLADRTHQAELLIDQNLGRVEADYQELIPADCRCLVGTQYALLSKAFGELRDSSLERRGTPRLDRLQISLGGMDPANVTSRVLRLLEDRRWPGEIEVIMGARAPHLESVRGISESLDLDVQLAVAVDDMPDRMQRADLAIGGAGVTAWERCALGLPSIVLVLAENQLRGAQALEQAGAAKAIYVLDDLEAELARHLDQLPEPGVLATLSSAAAALVDGRGLDRVCAALEHFQQP